MKHLFNKKLLVTTFIAFGLFSNVGAEVRNCEYRVYTESMSISKPISPFIINNGSIKFKGRSRETGNDRGYARLAAARTAESCLTAIFARKDTPRYCAQSNAGIDIWQGRALRLNLPNIKVSAYRELCSKIHEIYGGTSSRIISAKIFTKVMGSSDVRRECSFPASSTKIRRGTFWAEGVDPHSRYTTWDTNTLVCRRGSLRRLDNMGIAQYLEN